ncbi:MAG: hypothetical protein ACP5IL_15450 [Syntrophobacteraceae bacterium]
MGITTDKKEKILEILFTLFFVAAVEVIIESIIEIIKHKHLTCEILFFAIVFTILRIKIYLDDISWVFCSFNKPSKITMQPYNFYFAIITGIITWIFYIASAFALSHNVIMAYVILLVAICIATIALLFTPGINDDNKCIYTIFNIFYIVILVFIILCNTCCLGFLLILCTVADCVVNNPLKVFFVEENEAVQTNKRQKCILEKFGWVCSQLHRWAGETMPGPRILYAKVARDQGIEIISIDDALKNPDERYYCPECGGRLDRPFTGESPHFEHRVKNKQCSLSR